MKHMNLRVPDDIHARIKAASDADRRSLNAEILWLIEQALDQREGGSGLSAPA
jgi:predicted HicB family RNase H-like nuclease